MSDPQDSSSMISQPVARRGFAMVLMIVSSLQISFGGVVIRSIEVADVWQINFYRSVGFLGAILVILLFRYRSALPRAVVRVGWPGIAGACLTTVAGISFLHSLDHTTVANTLFVLSSIPFFAAFLAWLFLKETLNKATLITMLVAAAGLTVMVMESFAIGSLLGNFLALLTAFTFASYAVIVRRQRRIDMLPTLLLSGSLIILISLYQRWDDLAVPLSDILLCFLWGGLMSGIGNWFFIIASRHLLAAELTLFMLLEFAFGPVWVWLFIGEAPTNWTLVGGVVVIASVAIKATYELRQRSASRPK